MKKISLLVLFLLLTASICFYLSLVKYDAYSSCEDSFVANKPYLLVVKSLATKDSLEKLIEDSNGTLKHKQWNNFSVEVPRKILRLKEYKIEGDLEFTVEKEDNSLGNLVLPFNQTIKVDKSDFTIKTRLKSGQSNVLVCNRDVELFPSLDDPLKTQVQIKSELKIRKLIPYFFKDFMDKKVEQTNREDMEQLKRNLSRIIQSTIPVIQFKLQQ